MDDFELPCVRTDLPGPNSAAALASPTLNPAVRSHAHPLVQACWRDGLIEDLDGNTFVDHLSGWGSAPWGADARVAAALATAAATHGTQISSYVLSPPAVELAERLCALSPVPDAACEFSVTGTMAVESAVRIMRAATGRPLVLCFSGTFHGNSTTLTAALSSDDPDVSAHASQFAPGIVSVPYPQSHRSPFSGAPGPVDDCEVLDFLEHWVLGRLHRPDQFAGVLIEPVLTEGGVHVPSAAFWQRLSALCEQHQWLLCADEVQTGMGRCGPVFASRLWDLSPDLLLVGKGLSAGGAPISAVLARRELLERVDVVLGSTFGFSPPACAGALVGLDLLEALGDDHCTLSRLARDRLDPLVGTGRLARVTALGALVGIEVRTGEHTDRPAPNLAAALARACLLDGVLTMHEQHRPFLRLQPPFVLDTHLMAHSLEVIAGHLERLDAGCPPERDAPA